MQPAPQANIPFRLSYPEKMSVEDFVTDPPEGKTIFLANSKRSIDDVYIKYAEILEKRGVTLICQGLSGGAGRMRANFVSSESPVLWFLTPWAFEGVTLPANSADQLVIHPSHAILSRRAEHYQNAFVQYSLARLQHRLFRLLRSFSGYCKQGAEVLMLDDRLHSKSYGKDILSYLRQFEIEDANKDKGPQERLF